MATAELTVAFGAKLDGLEVSLKRVTQQLGTLQTKVQDVQRSTQDSADRMAQSWSGAVDSVKKFAAAYVGLRGLGVARDLVLAVDDINSAFRRLQAITGTSLNSAQAAFNQLRTTAASTGQPLADVANQFQRFFVATSSLGATNDQVQALVRTLSGFAQLSGQGPQEAAAAITQLAQGLASGKLQGDELKSILENMPQLAVALARELGVTVGQLRQMGEEGRLTSANVFPALLRAAAGLNNQLQGLPLTIRQAWQVLSDQFVGLVAEIDRRIGASANIQRFLAGLGTMLSELRTRAAGTGEGAASADRIANLGREASAASEKLRELQGLIREAEGGSGSRTDPAAPAGGTSAAQGRGLARLRAQAAEQVAIIEDRNRRIQELNESAAAQEFTDNQNRIRAGEQQRIGEAALIRRQALEAANPRLKIEREFQEALARINTSGATRMVAAAREGAAAVAQVERELGEERLAAAVVRDRELQAAGAAGRAAAEAEEVRRRREAREARRAQREQDARVEEIAQAAGNTLSTLNRQYADWADSSDRAASNYTDFINRIKGGTESVATLFAAVTREAIAAATSMQQAGLNPQPAITRMNEELATLAERLRAAGVAGGTIDTELNAAGQRAGRALDGLAAKSEMTFKEIAKQGIQTFAKDLSDEIIDFATTGEQQFTKMAADFTKMIAKMILQLMILRAIRLGLGAVGLGDLVSGTQTRSFNPDATGIAEGGDSARGFSTGTGLSSYFTGVSAAMPYAEPASSDVTVNVINKAEGTATRQQERTNGLGGKEIDIYVEQIVTRGINSGRFDTAMGQSFGASRRGVV
jgi:tape measure domain-containing protein